MKDIKIELSAMNELLDLDTKDKYLKSEKLGYQGVTSNSYYEDGVQGEHDEIFKFYSHPSLPENIVMKETYHSDSYGDNLALIEVKFVETKEKTIIVYE